MAKLNPYLMFNGDAEAAFSFYKAVFGGEFAAVMRFKDIPDQEGCENVSDADKEKIMHIALPVGDGDVLMAGDAPEAMGRLTAGNNFSLSVNAASREEADRFYGGLAEGGKAEMPMADAFWGDYFGMLCDRFGIHWMISYNEKYSK